MPDPHVPHVPLVRSPARATRAGILLAGLTAAAPVATGAQEPDTVDLPEIVATATRVPLHRDALPTPVTVMTGRELRERGIGSVADALRTVPGAMVVRAGSAGGQTSLFLRGGESDYVKVLIDGVPVNDPGGFIDFADLSTDQVERIEVVRGPASVLYGSDAVAGVVQIFTRRGRGEPTLTLSGAGGRGQRIRDDGAYGTLDLGASLAGAAGPLSYMVGGGRAWSDGAYPFNNERALNTASARLGWAPADGTELSAFTRFSDGESHFPTDGAGNRADRNALLDRRLWTSAIEAGRRLGDRIDARIQLGLNSRRQRSLDRQDAADDTLGVYASDLQWDVRRATLDARLDAELAGAVVTVGLDAYSARADKAYASESQFGPLEAEADYERTSRGYYAQALAEPLPGLDLTLGGRIDDNESFGTFATYRFGAALAVRPSLRLRAAMGRGFREPTFDESFGSGFGDTGNPALEPERSRSWEAGAELEPAQGARLAVTWFDQRFRDLIQFTFAPPTPDDPNYFNVGAATARGLEVEAEAAARDASLAAAYTWLRTSVDDPGLASDASFVQGEPLLRRPAHSGSLTARYRLGRGVAGLTVGLVGEREDLDFGAGFPAPRVTLEPYATVDLFAERTLPLGAGPVLDARVGVENLLDAEFETIRGFPAPGRAIRLGLRVRVGG